MCLCVRAFFLLFRITSDSDTLVIRANVCKISFITFRIYSLCDDPAANWNRNSIGPLQAATAEFDLLTLIHYMFAS